MGEGLALALILTTSQHYNVTSDPQYNNAIKHAALAAFVQTGAKNIADKETQKYEQVYKEVTPEAAQRVLGWTFWAYKVAQDGKIVYGWSF